MRKIVHYAICGVVLMVLAMVAPLPLAPRFPAAEASTVKTEVIDIDRTGVSTVKSWPSEVAAVVRNETARAIERGVDTLKIVSIGSNLSDSALIATVDLNLDCPNDNVCEEDAARLADQVGQVAGKVARTKAPNSGSDIVGSLQTAQALCGRAKCKILLVTDGNDSRLYNSTTPGDELAQQAASIVPSLKRTIVQLTGLGADGSDPTQNTPEAVERIRLFWQTLLSTKQARDIRIARSL